MYLGIDCGGTHLRLGLVEESGKLIAHSRTKSPLVSSPDKFGQIVFSEYSNLLHASPLPASLASQSHRRSGPELQRGEPLHASLKGIGVGVPGPIDRSSGSILHSANLHNDSPIYFVKQLEIAFRKPLTASRPLSARLAKGGQQKTTPDFSNSLNSLNSPQPPFVSSSTLNHPPVFFDRDAEVALWGEFWQGAARDCQNCLLLTLGTGIGGAIMADGKIISGVSDNAGEIGHMYLSLVNGKSEMVNRKKSNKIPSTIYQLPITNYPLPTCGLGHQGCFEAWLKNSLPEDKPYILGLGLASLVDIFNPAKIILGGGMIEYDEIDLKEVIAIMEDKAVQPLGTQTEVVKATLGDRAGVVGAAYLCIKKL